MTQATNKDGLKQYGKDRARVGLITCDEYRTLRENIPPLPDTWWWTATPDSPVNCSIIFSETERPEITNAVEVYYGGSGIDLENSLPDAIEHQTPDYSIYTQYDFAAGFLTRGCPRVNHTFCITPKKDGCVSRKVADLAEFWTGQKKIHLLDQNLLACKDRIDLLNQLAASGAEIDFKGGLDAHYMNAEIAAALKRVKVNNYFFAWIR